MIEREREGKRNTEGKTFIHKGRNSTNERKSVGERKIERCREMDIAKEID